MDKNSRPPRKIPGRVVRKYLLIHLLGLIPVTGSLFIAQHLFHFSTTLALVGLIGWCVKDAVLFPFVWKSYDSDASTASDPLVGKAAVVLEPLNPEGWVKIHGQRWKARLQSPTQRIDPPGKVIVQAREDLVLIVSSAAQTNDSPLTDPKSSD